MRKIYYPIGIEDLLSKYVNLFSDDWKKGWTALRNKILKVTKQPNLYPENVEKILIGSFEDLALIYEDYKSCGIEQNEADLHTELQQYFCYSAPLRAGNAEEVGDNPSYVAMQPTIAAFFMKYAMELNISSCSYCEMSYVNAYSLRSLYPTFADFISQCSETELRQCVRNAQGEYCSDITYKRIMKVRLLPEAKRVDAFNRIFNRGGEPKSDVIWNDCKNHFDLDHFLPKSICPLVGLSFYNFVPSCSVCNEKLKRKKELGKTVDEWKRVSPTSAEYKFDEEVKIRIATHDATGNLTHYLQSPDNYHVCFEADKDSIYNREIGMFRLPERYNYHKNEALRIHDVLIDYSDENLDKIKELLGNRYSREELKAEVLGLAKDIRNSVLMGKMRKDIIESCQKK